MENLNDLTKAQLIERIVAADSSADATALAARTKAELIETLQALTANPVPDADQRDAVIADILALDPDRDAAALELLNLQELEDLLAALQAPAEEPAEEPVPGPTEETIDTVREALDGQMARAGALMEENAALGARIASLEAELADARRPGTVFELTEGEVIAAKRIGGVLRAALDLDPNLAPADAPVLLGLARRLEALG